MPAFDDHILEIRLGGFTLLPDLLTPEECGEARRERGTRGSLALKNVEILAEIRVERLPGFSPGRQSRVGRARPTTSRGIER